MELLYVCMYQFYIEDDDIYTIPSFSDEFWGKYLEVFEQIHIVGEPLKEYLDKDKLTKLDTSHIKVDLLPSNNNPQDWKNDAIIKKTLESVIKKSRALIIKPASRKGIMAVKIAEKYNKPYMIEMTGDLYTALKYHTNPLKRIYAPIINHQILKAIRNCKFGVYVTDHYLQKSYPISGKTCGSSDAVIKYIDDSVLERRHKKIDELCSNSKINIGLVGFYHDSNKGIDTAIEAITRLNDERIFLHILGNGNNQDREKWYSFAEENGLKKDNLLFPEPIIGIDNMFNWYDSMDIIILPSRSEGLPRTIVEAMSRACPCITSNVCGLSELCEQKWTHDHGDSNALYILLNKMITSKEEMESASVYNFRHSKYYLESIQKKKRIDFMNEFKKYCEGI